MVAGRRIVLAVVAALALTTPARAQSPAADTGVDAVTRAAALAELSSQDPARRSAAIVRMGMVGRPEDLERVAGVFAREQHDLRTTAARALVGAGHAATIAYFTERSGGGRVADRLEALVILREVAALPPAARRAAERALADNDSALRLAALELLTVHPHADSVPMVAGALTDGNHEVRLAAVRLLGLTRDPRALLPLLDRLDLPDRGERVAVIDAIGAVGARPPLDAGPALVRQLGDANEDVRRAAIDALGNLRYAPAVSALRPLAGRAARDLLARRAILALGAIGDATAVRALVELLREADPLDEVGLALRRAGVAAVAPTATVLGDGYFSSTRLAAETLAAIGDRTATSALTGVLRARPTAAIPAARALGALRDPAAVPGLLAALEDGHYAAAPGVRAACLQALAAIGDGRAARAVAGAARDADADVRVAALDLAAAVRAGLSREALAAAFRDPDVMVQSAALRAATVLPGLATPQALVELIAAPIRPMGAGAEKDRLAVDAADVLESVVRPSDRTLLTQSLARAEPARRTLLARALDALAPRPTPWVRLRLRTTDGAPVAQRGLSLTDGRTALRARTGADGDVLLTALAVAHLGPGPYRVSVDGAAQAARTEATASGRSPAMTPELPRARDANVPAHP